MLLTVVLAFVINLTLDLWHGGGPIGHAVAHSVTPELSLLLLGASVVWTFVILVVAVVGRLWIGVGVVAVLTVLLCLASYRKEQLVQEPLYPSDLAFVSDPGLLVEMAGAEVLLLLFAASAAAIVLAVLAGRRLSRWFPRPDRRASPRLAWVLIGARFAGAVVSIAVISYLMRFHDSGNLFKAAYDEHGAHWRPWHQSANYAENGFVAGMLYNLPLPAMQKPAGYGPARMRELARRYAAVADRINRHRDPAALDDVNVVFVLSESFSDPTRVRGVEFAEDPIPYTRSLMEHTTAGNMWSQKYGGGTANAEFEALTGMSLALFRPQMSTPYHMLVPNHAEFPSAVGVLQQHGLRTLAMHSFTSALYRRAEVYPILGFDDIVFEDDMDHADTVEDNPFISDQATFEEVLARLADAEQPMFLNVVTMQNHFPMAGKYADPIRTVGLPDEETTERVGQYARGLRYSDQAMRHLVQTLEGSDEKTVVVFYGDHLAPIWPATTLTRRIKHETPFLVYANFGEPAAKRLPTTSPVHFLNHVLDLTGAYVPPYYALLRQLEQEIPAMGLDMMIGPHDTALPPDELPIRAQRLLQDYRLVQYDLSMGQRYSADALFDAGLPARMHIGSPLAPRLQPSRWSLVVGVASSVAASRAMGPRASRRASVTRPRAPQLLGTAKTEPPESGIGAETP